MRRRTGERSEASILGTSGDHGSLVVNRFPKSCDVWAGRVANIQADHNSEEAERPLNSGRSTRWCTSLARFLAPLRLFLPRGTGFNVPVHHATSSEYVVRTGAIGMNQVSGRDRVATRRKSRIFLYRQRDPASTEMPQNNHPRARTTLGMGTGKTHFTFPSRS